MNVLQKYIIDDGNGISGNERVGTARTLGTGVMDDDVTVNRTQIG